MGKSFRSRTEKRKLEQSAVKHAPPSRKGAAGSSKNSSRGGAGGRSTAVAMLSPPFETLLQRSPVLSSYLAPQSNVLVVGDGDFSFGRALVQLRSKYRQQLKTSTGGVPLRQLGSLTVTGYDSRAEALRKYGSGIMETNWHIIEKEPGAIVLHSIDATTLKEQLCSGSGPNNSSTFGTASPAGQQKQRHRTKSSDYYYNIVVFNFPHSGEQRVHINRNLMNDFFHSVRALFLAQDDDDNDEKQQRKAPPRQVHVTIKNQRPYIHWGIEESALEAGFVMNDRNNKKTKNSKVRFDMDLWNALGYRHQTTLGPLEATSQPPLLANEAEAKLAQTWIFEFQPDLDNDDRHSRQNGDDNNNNNNTKTPTNVMDAAAAAAATRKGTKPTAAVMCEESTRRRLRQENSARTTTRKDEEPLADDGDDLKEKRRDETNVSNALIDDLVQQRDQARKDKNWADADRIRTLLITTYGVILCDQQKVSTSWSWKKKGSTQKASSTPNRL